MLDYEIVKKTLHNPVAMQHLVLDEIDAGYENKNVIVDPTNPVMMLLEAIVTGTAAGLDETYSTVRKIYPKLAIEGGDLFHLLSDNELDNIFAIPSTGVFYIRIPVTDITTYGTVGNDGTGNAISSTVTLPMYTTITVNGVMFTLLNDINVTINKSGVPTVIQLQGDANAFNDVGLLPSALVTDTDGVPFVGFSLRLKQVTKTSVVEKMTISNKLDITVPLNGDSLYYAVCSELTSNMGPVILGQSYSNEFLDGKSKTVYISRHPDAVNFNLPSIYTTHISSGNSIAIDVFTTQGELYLPLARYEQNEFIVNIPNGHISANVQVIANGTLPLTGGRNEKSIEELREMIVQNSTGPNSVPITDYSMKDSVTSEGFTAFKDIDVLTDRIYTVTRDLPDYNNNSIYTKMNIFNNFIKVNPADYRNDAGGSDNAFIGINNASNIITIRPGAVFENKNNVMELINNDEYAKIKSSLLTGDPSTVTGNKYFFTPYAYMLDTSNNNLMDASIYQLDAPKISNLLIMSRGVTTTGVANTNRHGVIRNTNGSYKMKFEIISNDVLDATIVKDATSVKFVIVIPLTNGMVMHLSTTLKNTTKLFTIDLQTTGDILNGELVVNTEIYNMDTPTKLTIFEIASKLLVADPSTQTITIPLEFKTTNYIYTEDASVDEGKGVDLVSNNLLGLADTALTTIYSKETMDIELGKEITTLWNRVNTVGTGRSYEQYTAGEHIPVPGHYKYDDVTDSYVFEPSTTKEAIGGEYKVDTNGNRIVSETNIDGRELWLDVLMLEYEYRAVTERSGSLYLTEMLDVINNWLNNDIPNMNKNVLEKTNILFRGTRSVESVRIMVNDVIKKIPSLVSPKIKLYTNRNDFTEDEHKLINIRVSNVLEKWLSEVYIAKHLITEDIKKVLGADVLAVNITGLDDVVGGDYESFKIMDMGRRLSLRKNLVTTFNNDAIVVKNDITIEILKI